jgi:tetratricopeptide (TPR) repeat protein
MPDYENDTQSELNCPPPGEGNTLASGDWAPPREHLGHRKLAKPLQKLYRLHRRLAASREASVPEPDRKYCPDELTITAFVEETLEPPERQRVCKHLQSCPECRVLVDEVRIAAAPDPPTAEVVLQQIQRRKRLHELVNIARKCVGGSKTHLATELGCDPADLYPETGDPDPRFVAALAKVLDWTFDVVMDFVDGHGFQNDHGPTTVQQGCDTAGAGATEFEALDSAAKLNYWNEQRKEALEFARRAYTSATTAEERAASCVLQGAVWHQLGQNDRACRAYRRGLREWPISHTRRQMLLVNLANALCSLDELHEARDIANNIIKWFERHRPSGRSDMGSQAFAFYVRANVFRRHMERSHEKAATYARRARLDFERAEQGFRLIYKDCKDPNTGGIANTCRGGVILTQAAFGERDPRAALSELTKGVMSVNEPSEWPRNDWLESFGWWSVFGAHLALRYLPRPERNREGEKLIDQGLKIASRLQNWSMHERLFSTWYEFWKRDPERRNQNIEPLLTREQLNLVAGSIGRFPTFRRIGLEILVHAKTKSQC